MITRGAGPMRDGGAGQHGRGSALLGLRCRQGVLAAGLDQLLGDREAHERAPDVVPGMPIGEGGDDRAPGTRHAIAKQGQDIGRHLHDDGIDVGGGRELRG
jgi:hypothetical protein